MTMAMTQRSLSPGMPSPGTWKPASSYEEVRRKVDSRRIVFAGLNQRQAYDQDLYDLIPFNGEVALDEDLTSNKYRTYTSNEPQVVANKLIKLALSSKLTFKITTGRETEEKRTLNQGKKDFLYAALKMGEKTQMKYQRGGIKEQLTYYIAMRGWFAGRSLLRPGADGNTMVDIMPWDPMQVVWDVGPDGLLWACKLSYETYSEVKAAHPGMRKLTTQEMDSQERMMVYDYYDGRSNVVFSESEDIKHGTPHGSPVIPIFLGHTGGQPMSSGHGYYGTYQNGSFAVSGSGYGGYGSYDDSMTRVGESVYQSTRDIYPKLNFVRSVLLEYVARTQDPPIVTQSEGGQRSAGENPLRTGNEIQADIKDKISALPLPETTDDLKIFLDVVSGELQRGTVSHTSFGELSFQLSGYALNTLTKNLEDQVAPILNSLMDAYAQISDNLCAQYGTGFFAPIPIPGEMDKAMPELIRLADPVETVFKANLPRDMAAEIQMAVTLRTPDASGRPIVDDPFILENILRVEDIEGMSDRINEQMAGALVPTAQLWTYFESALNRGQEDIAREIMMAYQVYQMKQQLELQLLQMQTMMAGMGPGAGGPPGHGGGPGGPGPGPGAGGGVPGISPKVSPQAAMGVPPPTPFPQGGSLLGPGSPRPGARNQSFV